MISKLNYDLKFLDECIYSYLVSEKNLSYKVSIAMNEAIKNGGKRIRPLLMYETYKLFSENIELDDIKVFMASIEFIHTFSLIHDDLPALDNDKYRRGKKSTWYEYGEAFAILAGDGLLLEAFDMVLKETLNKDDIQAKKMLRALRVLSKKTGMSGMIAGQVLDVDKTGKSLNKEELSYIYSLKTSALIEAAMIIGAILADAKDEEILEIEKIAQNVGLAFQIQDDILDVISSKEELGKDIGSDKDNNKTTYVSLYGLEEAKKEVNRLSREAIFILQSFNKDSASLESIIEALINRKK